MNRFDYKECWQEFYDEAIEELGMDEDEAGEYATAQATDQLAAMADDAHDRAKERDL